MCSICTSPAVFFTLQVPHRPKLHPEGMFSPARFAAASTVSPGAQAVLTPEAVKLISAASGTASASGAGAVSGGPKLS